MRYLLLLCLFVLGIPMWASALDTCNAAQYGMCTLPCGTVTSTPTQLLGVNNKRVELMVANTGSVTVYVIIGKGNSGYDSTYGIPVAPQGSGGALLDLQIQPVSGSPVHTWTGIVSVATASGNGSCVYGEQSN